MGAAYEYTPVQPEQEVHQQSSSSSSSSSSSCADGCVVFLFLFTIAALITAFFAALCFLGDQALGQEPHYSVAINHVSGLDPTTDLGHEPTLQPEFNLTFRVASWGLWVTECAEPRMYATVSYRGVPLAASGTLTQKICAGPMKAVEHHVVARGAAVIVPGSILDSLAMDMRSGVPGFDVELHGPGPRKMVWPCGPRMVGDACDLERACMPGPS